jgi:predicted esterase
MDDIIKRAAAIVIAFLAVRPAFAQELDRAKLLEKVVCQAEPGQSYALYLPSTFDPGRTWPILLLFDPGARGPLAVEAFRAAAETFGWILVGSNNSKNGPMEASVRAARAIWADVRERLPIDVRRIYAAGFSGGARVASLFPRIVGERIAGVVGCGAGLAAGIKPDELGAAAFFGLVGFADFNYGEMKRLDRDFDPSGLPHRFLFFDGGHAWPDQAACARAVAWMEITAMKLGLRSQDKALIDDVIGKELEEARSFEDAGRTFWAVDRLESAGRLAEGLTELSGLPARIEALKSRREYERFLAAEKARDRREDDFRAGFARAFGAVEADEAGGGTAVGPVLREMKIGFLKKEAKTAKIVEERSLASRLLFEFSFAAQNRGADLFEKGHIPRACAYYDLAIESCEPGLPREKYLYFNRARIAALAGEKKRALELLAAAVDKGFADIDLLETTKDLDPVRSSERFREIIEKVRALAQR